MLEITPAKVIQIIFQAREGRVAEAELHAFLAGLNDWPGSDAVRSRPRNLPRPLPPRLPRPARPPRIT